MTRSARTLIAPLLAVVLGLILASQALAATPISPTGGTLSSGPLTTFTWALNAGEDAFPVLLHVSTSPVLAADGGFLWGNEVGCSPGVVQNVNPKPWEIVEDELSVCGRLTDGLTTSMALPQGNYWWQLTYYANGSVHTHTATAPQAFSVPAARAPSAVAPADGANLSKTGSVTLAITTGDAAVSGYAIARTRAELGASDAFRPLSDDDDDVVTDTNGVLRVLLDGGLPNGGLAAGTYWWAYQYAPLGTGTVGSIIGDVSSLLTSTPRRFTIPPYVAHPAAAQVTRQTLRRCEVLLTACSTRAQRAQVRTLRVPVTFDSNTQAGGTVRATLRRHGRDLASASMRFTTDPETDDNLAAHYDPAGDPLVVIRVPDSARPGSYQIVLTVTSQGVTATSTTPYRLTPRTRRGWTTDGRCVVPDASQGAVVNVGSDTKLVARGIPCYQAATSAQAMMNAYVQGTRPAHFTFRTSGALIADAPVAPGDSTTGLRWDYRWTCVRRNVIDPSAGPVFPTTCTSGNARITLVLEP